MDCKTARMMLEFARPHHAELDPLDLRAVEGHVASCPECALSAQQERAFDDQLGMAMNKVDVPDRLQARLLKRLASERAAAQKWRWKRYVSGGLAAAALLLLAVGGWAAYHQATLKPFDLASFEKKVMEEEQNPPHRDDMENDFRSRGLETTLPPNFHYAYLAFHGTAELQNQQVPCLVFIRTEGDDATISGFAKVYVLSERQFNLKDLPANYRSPPGYSGKFNIDIERDPDTHCVYVIVHTGKDLDWLR